MRLVLLVFLFLPALAFAEPLTATAFVIGSGATAVAVSWGTVIFTIGSMLYGAANQRKQKKAAAAAERAQRDAFNSGLRDRVISGIATEFPYRYVYGVARVGANVVAMFSTGARDEYKHLICVLAQHQSESIDEIYINGQALGALDGSGGVTGGPFLKIETNSYTETLIAAASPPHTMTLARTPNAGSVSVIGVESIPETGATQQVAVPFTIAGNVVTVFAYGSYTITYQVTTQTSMVRVTKHLGTPSDTVDANTYADTGGRWPATAVLRGHTYFALRLNLNQAEFQGGLPQIEALMHGKLVYDPRSTLTEWSDNNSLCTLDYLKSELGGVLESSIPTASYISAANDCDDTVSTGSWTGKRYTMNGVVTSDQSREEVLEKMAQSMAGGIDATTWTIFAGKYSAPVMAVNQEDIVGEFAISPGLPLNDIFNTVKGQYVSSENSYVATDFTPYQNASYLAIDGEELTTDMDMALTNSQQRCTNLARIATEQNRNGFTISGKFSLKLWKLQVGQRFTFTSEFFGMSAKVFRLTDKGFKPDGMMQISAVEDAESIYDLADETQADATPNTDLPNPFQIDALASVTCVSGDAQLLVQADKTIVSRILVTWPISTTQGVLQNGTIEIEWQQVTETETGEWQKTTVNGDETQVYLSPVEDNSFYKVRARAVNPYVSTKSDWVYAELHQVSGKSELPPDVLGFTIDGTRLTWDAVVAQDLAGYEIRFNYGVNTWWDAAASLHGGLLTSSPYIMSQRPQGQVTLLIKAVDTSGNYSETATPIVANLGDTLADNLLLSWPQAPTFGDGAIVGGTVIGGELVADGVDEFFSPGNEAMFSPDTDDFFPSGQYGDMTYTWSVTPTDSGTLLLDHEIEGVNFQIEYARGSQDAIFSPAGNFFFTPSAELMFGEASGFSVWPGSLSITEPEEITFRITIYGGVVQGAIVEATAILDVPDIVESFNDIVISAAGTRLTPSQTFRVIENVSLTAQGDGNGGIAPRLKDGDKDPLLGPLVEVLNAAGTPVDGLIDAVIQGY